MKILATGCRGMLGSALPIVFDKSGYEIMPTVSITLDVRNIKQVMSYVHYKPDIILNLAGSTDHAACEFSPEDAYMVNFVGAQNMTELARSLDIPIVYIGTCGIHDGSKEAYTENDSPCPLNHYGRSKYYGELATRSWKRHYIIRCGWGMGGGPLIDKKFVNKLYSQIYSGVKELYAISDVYGNPTYNIDFMQTIKNILDKGLAYGTYNAGGTGVASRAQVAYELVSLLKSDIRIIPLSYDDYHKKFGIQVLYTKREVLDMSKLIKTGCSAMRPWQEALADYVNTFYKAKEQ